MLECSRQLHHDRQLPPSATAVSVSPSRAAHTRAVVVPRLLLNGRRVVLSYLWTRRMWPEGLASRSRGRA